MNSADIKMCLMNSARAPANLRWLFAAAAINANMSLCIENRSLAASKSVSAGVIIENTTKTALIYVGVDLTWLTGMRLHSISPLMRTEPGILEAGNLVVHQISRGADAEVHSSPSVVDILLQFTDEKATYIRFPWLANDVHLLKDVDKWVFMSHESYVDPNQETYFWAYGYFKGQSDAENTVRRMIRMPYMPGMMEETGMSTFQGPERPSIATISDIIPGGIKAVETRPFDQCEQLSAYVVFDKDVDAAVLYIDRSLAPLEATPPRKLHIQTVFDWDGYRANNQRDTPQMVQVGSTMIMNYYSSMRFLFAHKDKNAIDIKIPWPKDMFNQFKGRRAFMFVGLHDGRAFFYGDLTDRDEAYLRNRYVNEVFGCGGSKEMKYSQLSTTERLASPEELLEALSEALDEIPELKEVREKERQALLMEQEED